jgi:cell division septation protein DedD
MGARTYPTVNASPVMNKQNAEKKEIRLGMMQVVMLSGLTIGSIAAAFFLGFFVGRSVGFENEISSMVASLPKLPIVATENNQESGDKVISEVFAKLNEPTNASELVAADGANGGRVANTEHAADTMPELGSIQAVEVMTPSPLPVIEMSDNKEASHIKEGSKQDDKPTLGDVVKVEQPKLDTHKPTALNGSPIKVNVEQEKLASKNEIKQEASSVQGKPEVLNVKPKELVDEKKKGSISLSAVIPNGWYAQIAAPKQITDAQEVASNLKKSGFAVMIETAQVRGKPYYRVLVGPENSKSQADILLKQLKRESYLKGEPFLRMVK